MAELAVEAGFPEGVINIVTGGLPGPRWSITLASTMVAFTGSTTTGTEIALAAAKTVRPAILELGGKSPSSSERCESGLGSGDGGRGDSFQYGTGLARRLAIAGAGARVQPSR